MGDDEERRRLTGPSISSTAVGIAWPRFVGENVFRRKFGGRDPKVEESRAKMTVGRKSSKFELADR